jgi:hypothetical protein
MLNGASATLAWLGRQGARAIAAVVLIAIAVPPFDALLRPFVTEAIFALLCIAFLRVDTAALRGHIRKPGLVLAATAWSSLVLPAVCGTVCLLLRLDARMPDLFLGLMLQAVASPMMAAPAFAAIMGLDATLVLATLVTSTALTPLSAPLFAYLFYGPALSLSPLALGLKLFAILAGSLLVAIAIRRIVGLPAIKRCSDHRAGRDDCADGSGLRHHVCGARLDRARLRQGRPRARFRARHDGLTAQYGTDARRNRRRAARFHLALLRAVAVSDLSVAADADALGTAVENNGK